MASSLFGAFSVHSTNVYCQLPLFYSLFLKPSTYLEEMATAVRVLVELARVWGENPG
jgi:hypothetical protein